MCRAGGAGRAARRGLPARGGAAGLRRGHRAARGARSARGPGASPCAIRARAGGRAPRAGDLMFSWRLVMAPRGGARLRRGARGRASGRDEPLAALLGGGAPALPRTTTRPRDWLRRHGAGLHAYDFRATRRLTRAARPRSRMRPMIERERLSETSLPAHERVYRTPAGAGDARAGGAGRGADAARHRGGVRRQHDPGARGGAPAGGGGRAEALGLGAGLDAGADQRAHRGAGGAARAARARARQPRAAAGACGADRPDGRRSTASSTR